MDLKYKTDKVLHMCGYEFHVYARIKWVYNSDFGLFQCRLFRIPCSKFQLVHYFLDKWPFLTQQTKRWFESIQ